MEKCNVHLSVHTIIYTMIVNGAIRWKITGLAEIIKRIDEHVLFYCVLVGR